MPRRGWSPPREIEPKAFVPVPWCGSYEVADSSPAWSDVQVRTVKPGVQIPNSRFRPPRIGGVGRDLNSEAWSPGEANVPATFRGEPLPKEWQWELGPIERVYLVG